MPLSQHQQDLLAEVTQARTALRTLRSELEAEIERKIALARDASDLAIRKAYNAGARKADILRASGTRNFGTIQESLDRTEGVSVALEEVVNAGKFSWRGTLLVVNEEDNVVEFEPHYREDTDDYIFYTEAPLWNTDWTGQNALVAGLDAKTSGPLWDEANAWMKGNTK